MTDTMRAVIATSLTGPDGLELRGVPLPKSGPDDVVIDVHAAGVGFPDLLMTKGQYQFRPEPPFPPGVEIAGVVRGAPEGSGLKPGDRVAASSRLGAWADVAVSAPHATFPMPDGMAFDEATAFVNYQTAYFAFAWRGGLRAGETVLVHGAAGGTGTTAIEVAKALGAKTIAIARGEAKREVALAAGAGHALEVESEWLPQVKELTGGRGVDVVYDPVGGDRFVDSLRALAPGGRVLVIGFASGMIPEVKINRLLLRNTSIIGAAWGEYQRHDPSMPGKCAAELNKLYEAGHIHPIIGGRYPLERAADALREIEQRRATGKIVLIVRGS